MKQIHESGKFRWTQMRKGIQEQYLSLPSFAPLRLCVDGTWV
jgi:hypothetical protein